MQTFLPFPDFEQSARSLDQKRLGKQRVECIQVEAGFADSCAATIGTELRSIGVTTVRNQ